MNKIALTGMMGSGKTTLGKKFAKEKDLNFYDLDQLIEEHEKQSLNEIFSQKGERYFREIESQILTSFLQRQKSSCVLALGGGTFTSFHRKLLHEHGFKTIYLKCGSTLLLQRLLHDRDNRPLLKDLTCNELQTKIETLLKLREGDYLQADLTIEVQDEQALKSLFSHHF